MTAFPPRPIWHGDYHFHSPCQSAGGLPATSNGRCNTARATVAAQMKSWKRGYGETEMSAERGWIGEPQPPKEWHTPGWVKTGGQHFVNCRANECHVLPADDRLAH